MEARRSSRRSDLLLLFLLIIAFSVNLLPSPIISSVGAAAAAEEEKVELTLYYETLCPFCSNFIVNYLYKLFDGGLDSIVDLKFSPYGNAKILSNGTISCQHGPWECLLNTIEACAIHVWPNLNDHFPFIYCVEKLIYEDRYAEWETCFEKLNLDSKPVTDCYSSGYGDKLELKYAAETKALQPPHTYVPWVVVDGQPLYDDYPYFISFICKAYKGSNVPQACRETSLISIPKERANLIHPVCHREENTKTTQSKISLALASRMSEVGMTSSI